MQKCPEHCETCQSQSKIPPSVPPSSTGVIVHPSLFIPHPSLISILYLCRDLWLSNGGIYHVPLTAGTAGAGLRAECCPLWLCECVRRRVWSGVHRQTSALRGAMGHDVANTKPEISVTLWHINSSDCMRTQGRTVEDNRAQTRRHPPTAVSAPFFYYHTP